MDVNSLHDDIQENTASTRLIQLEISYVPNRAHAEQKRVVV